MIITTLTTLVGPGLAQNAISKRPGTTVIVYDDFHKGGGYTLADYDAKWSTNTLGEMAIADTRQFDNHSLSISATPFRTGKDSSVSDNTKYLAVSKRVFAVPQIGSITVSMDIAAETPGTVKGRVVHGTCANLRVERHGTTFVVPLVGNSRQRYSVLRFTRKPLVIPRGSTVTWTMRDTFEIHTVTFTSGEKPPEFVVPEPQPKGPPKVLLNPKALTPTTATQYDGSGYINSGMLFPPGNPGKLPSSFSLTFTKPGRYEYWCLIHADVGQRSAIIVE